VVGSFWSMHNKIVNCHDCLSRNKDDRVIEADRQRKGCYEPKKDVLFQNSGIDFYKCIGNYTSLAFPYLYDGYLQFKASNSPIWGMSAKLVDIYKLIDNLVTEYESDKLKEKSSGRK